MRPGNSPRYDLRGLATVLGTTYVDWELCGLGKLSWSTELCGLGSMRTASPDSSPSVQTSLVHGTPRHLLHPQGGDIVDDLLGLRPRHRPCNARECAIPITGPCATRAYRDTSAVSALPTTFARIGDSSAAERTEYPSAVLALRAAFARIPDSSARTYRVMALRPGRSHSCPP